MKAGALSKECLEWWKEMEEVLGCKAPQKVKEALDEFGYNNHISMSKMTKEDIDEMKEISTQKIPPVLLASGHIHLIEGLIKASQKCLDKPKMFRKSGGRQMQNQDLSQQASGSNNTGNLNEAEKIKIMELHLTQLRKLIRSGLETAKKELCPEAYSKAKADINVDVDEGFQKAFAECPICARVEGSAV